MKANGIRAKAAAATRSHIVDCAKALFATEGYEAISIERIVEAAGVTKGALYHHFKNKRALFETVFEAAEIELSGRASPELAQAEGADTWSRYRIRVQTYLDAILDARFHQILLVDGPAVFGWAEWRSREAAHGIESLTKALSQAIDEGNVPPLPVPPLADIVVAAIHEAALTIVNATDRASARHEIGPVLDHFLAGIARTD